MTASVIPITQKIIWDQYMARIRPPTFLHTWEWGEFQNNLGHHILRIGVTEDSVLVAAGLLITIQSKKGSFVLCPHGPVFRELNEETESLQKGLQAFLDFAKEYTAKQSCAYLRIAPLLKKNPRIESIFQTSGFRSAPIHVHPERAWILDITPSEDDLLKSVRKTTRYSIRKAIKDGVRIRKSKDIKDLKTFYDLYLSTVQRQHFTPFPYSYIVKEMEHFCAGKGSDTTDAEIFFAEYQGKAIAAAFVVFTSWSGFYHHGAASLAYPKIPASYLVQWEALREAKQRGCAQYNFWGIAHNNPKNIFDLLLRRIRPTHPWQGLTLFKTGFGGFEQQYIHAQDYVLNSRYFLTSLVESVRRLRRGL